MISSSFCVVLMVRHSWIMRGRRVTLFFFTTCTIYAILRGHAVRYITTEQWEGAIPYFFSHPTLQIFGEPVPAIVGWIFTIYLSWCLAEKILERLILPQTHLFALVCFAFLSTASISYVVEAAAHSARWWSWALSMKNPLFVAVPIIGVIDWSAIISDFFLPFLLFFLSPVRKTLWRWLLFLPFFFHMLAHTPYQVYLPILGYDYVFIHILIFLVPLLIAFWFPSWSKMEISQPAKAVKAHFSPWIPLMVYSILLWVTFGMQIKAGLAVDHLISFGPILMMGILAFIGIRASLIALVPILLLAILHDPRWLTASGIPLFSLLMMATSGSSKSISNENFKQDRSGKIRLYRILATLLVLILSGGIMIGMYWFEEKCRIYERVKLEAVIRNDSSINNRYQLQEVLTEAPASADFLVQLADRLEKRHAPSWIIAKHYEKAIDCDPEYSVPYNKLAKVYLQLGEENRAIDILQKGHQHIPSNPKILNNLGFYYDRVGKTSKAIDCFEKALEISPSDTMIWLNLAQAYLSLSDTNAVSYCLSQAEKLGDSSPSLKKKLGEALIQAERYQEALLLLTGMMPQYSEDAEIHHQLAELYSIMEDPAKAIYHYRKVLRIQPERYDAMINLGILLAGQGNIDEAYALFEKASQYKPNHPVILCNQGLALERKKQVLPGSRKVSTSIRI